MEVTGTNGGANWEVSTSQFSVQVGGTAPFNTSSASVVVLEGCDTSGGTYSFVASAFPDSAGKFSFTIERSAWKFYRLKHPVESSVASGAGTFTARIALR